MKIIEVLKIRKYLGLAIIFAVALFAFYAYTQVLFIVGNLDLWLATIPRYNLALFSIFAALFGITLSYQVYLKQQPKTCSIAKTSSAGALGTFVSFFAVQCPACASIGVLFLPVSTIALLTVYSTLINLASIGLVLLTLYLLGGFKKS